MTVELWRVGGSIRNHPGLAQEREAEGWDGQTFMDSSALSADPFVLMGAWAMATERLMLRSGVTNPFTRHPAVIAGAIASLQLVSGGRAVLGIGRGDSALAYIGRAPVGLAGFTRSLRDLQVLLSGGEIPFDTGAGFVTAPPVDTLHLGNRPETTGLRWLPDGLAKVPIDVAATGPRVIALSAPIVERLTFAVGATPERIAWAIEEARRARRQHGLDDEGISFGAQVVVICHPDPDAVLDVAARLVTAQARFQVLQQGASGPLTGSDAVNLERIAAYDMTKHSDTTSHDMLGGATFSDDFVRRFAIVGSPDHCVERLLELHALGIERFAISGIGYHPEVDPDGPPLFVREALPVVRREAGYHPGPA